VLPSNLGKDWGRLIEGGSYLIFPNHVA